MLEDLMNYLRQNCYTRNNALTEWSVTFEELPDEAKSKFFQLQNEYYILSICFDEVSAFIFG